MEIFMMVVMLCEAAAGSGNILGCLTPLSDGARCLVAGSPPSEGVKHLASIPAEYCFDRTDCIPEI